MYRTPKARPNFTTSNFTTSNLTGKKGFHSPTTAASESHSLRNSRNVIRNVRLSLSMMIEEAVDKRDSTHHAISTVYNTNKELLEQLSPGPRQDQQLKMELEQIRRENEQLMHEVTMMEQSNRSLINAYPQQLLLEIQRLKSQGDELRRNTIHLLNRK